MPDRQPPSPQADGTHGDLAIVLHSHMPYVEGYGTYPFGEEWLFDAVIRSYLPILEFARDITLTVTPVLADQLEDEACADRLRAFLLEHRIGAAEKDASEVPAECRPAAAAEAARFTCALEALDRAGGKPLAPFQDAAAQGRIAVAASSATHAVLPLIATRAGRRLQIDAGLRSHRRRFNGWGGGFWLPECAYEPDLDALLAEHGVQWFCVDRSAHEPAQEALRPIRTRLGAGGSSSRTDGPSPSPGPLAFTIDWEAVSWLWSWEGYPSHPDYAQFEGKSMRGTRIWRIGGGAYDPVAAAEAARAQAREFATAIAARLRDYAGRQGRRGLITFAVDTELIGHWWSEGPIWLEEVLRLLPEAGVRLTTLDRAASDPGLEPRESVPAVSSTWGEGKDLRTWDSPPVADMARAARRLELRLLKAIDAGLDADRVERAARELLAVQASDWAFLDSRSQAGDYAFERATQHAHSLLEAIECTSRPPDPRLRALAPDLSPGPLLEP